MLSERAVGGVLQSDRECGNDCVAGIFLARKFVCYPINNIIVGSQQVIVADGLQTCLAVGIIADYMSKFISVRIISALFS